MAAWPLVGRDRELESLLRHFLAESGGIVLAGPAGVGKTRLATELLRAVADRGFATLRVAATQASAGLPFGPFATLLPDLPPGLDQVRMLRQVTQAVLARGEGRRFVILIDDAHLLDDASAALTHHLAVSGAARVLATVRSGEASSDAVLALWKDVLAERIEIRPLTEDQVDELLQTVLGAPVDRGSRGLLFERSSGNVLFLRELVLGALDAGLLRRRVGVWHLDGRLPASARLIELVEARLTGLSDQDRTGMELLALGQPLEAETFDRLVGDQTLPVLERRHLVIVERDGQRLDVRLGHPLYGDVLQGLLSPTRARTLYRALADADPSHRPEDTLRKATWRLEGGGLVDPATMLAAARRAWTLYELPVAERLARAALAAGGGFGAQLLLGQVLSSSGRPEDAERQLAGLVRTASDDQDKVLLAITRIDNLCYSMGRLDQGLAVAEQAEAAIADIDSRNEITAYRASLLDMSGDTAAALAVARPLVEQGEGPGPAWASVIAASTMARSGAIGEALRISQRGMAAATTPGATPLPWPGAHAAVQSWTWLFGGQLAEAENLARAEYERGIADGSTETEFLMAGILGQINLAQGRVLTAARLARESAPLARDHRRVIHSRLALLVLAEALALTGQVAEAAAALAELEAASVPFVHMMDAETLRVRAWGAVAVGDLTKAKGLLQQAATVAATSSDLVWEGAALHDLARLGAAASVVGRLQELAGLVEGPLTRTRAAHAVALASRKPPKLLEASAAFEEMGALLLAAEAAADAAATWRRKGDTRNANAAARRSDRLGGACEGARTPALATDSEARAALSARELETARLAAAGFANRDIAAQLHLSHRTVENKLSVAYRKLGVEGRDQLAAALEGL